MPGYDHHAIEAKWREAWKRERIWETDLHAAPHPYYNLMMFPYPSAEGLHVGNVFAFTGADIHGRFMAMRGYDVFEPMGFDAFGIHSENYALKINEHPARLIERNTRRFTEQLRRMGGRFDWSHAVYTTDPSYYKWTQWLFLQLYKGGLAYQDRAPVNWCPSCKTVLADEQVVDGRCERCETPVTQRDLTQWFLRIIRYAGQLLDQLDDLDWSEVVKTAQRNWIGRSAGVEIHFPVEGLEGEKIDCFTTRPDTIFGVTYLALAPEHPMLGRLTTPAERAGVEAYAAQAIERAAMDRLSGEREKTGVFTGSHAVNPLSGERIPIWVADYVLAGYGSGAVMGVPAHDERDFAFARAMGLPVRVVVAPPGGDNGDGKGDSQSKVDSHGKAAEKNGNGDGGREIAEAYTGPGRLVNSGDFTGLDSTEAWRLIADRIEERGLGERKVTYRLRDWLISRQRYWGPPIPIIHCNTCGTVPVPEEDLPVLLPDVEDFKPLGTGQSPLASVRNG
ncbi:MAG: leucine--tRNA ligase [Syntrophothermus sp.]